MPRWRRCSRSDRAGCGRRPKRGRSATAASPWWRGPRGSRRRRSAGAARLDARRPLPATDAPARRRAEAGDRAPTRRCCGTWTRWSSRRRPAIRTRRCAGRCLSARTLAVALEALGHHVSHTVVAELLHGLGYSLQGNVKTREGRQHPDRDAQFRYIARQVARGAATADSRRSRWTRRRRSWSATSRTAAATGGPARRRSACASTTS